LDYQEIIRHVPDICPTPLCKVIPHTSIGNKEFRAKWIACISKEVFTLGNVKISGDRIIVHVCVCGGPLPSRKCVCEFHIKISDEKSILRKKSLAVVVPFTNEGWRVSWNVTAVNCTNSITEEWPEFRIVTDF
jgi:hypothetical protein